MRNQDTQEDFVGVFEKSILVAGAVLLALGVIGIFAPHVISITLSVFIGLMMLVGGVFFAYYSYQYHTKSFMGWLKPVILITGFGLAYIRHPAPGWGWLFFNGLLSLTLALLLLVGWPATSPVLLGFYISISLFFDGLSLFMLGVRLKKTQQEMEGR